MKMTYDKIADAMYIYFRKAKVFKTAKMTDRLLVDLDKEGKILGIEILDVSSQIKQKNGAGLKVKIPSLA